MKDPVAQRQLESKRVGAGCDRQEPTTRVLPDTSRASPRRPTEHALEPCEGRASWLGGTQEVGDLLEQQCPHLQKGTSPELSKEQTPLSGLHKQRHPHMCYVPGLSNKPRLQAPGQPTPPAPCPTQPTPGLFQVAEGWKCRDKLTAGSPLTLHLHPGTAWDPAFTFSGLRFITVEQGHLAQGHTKNCSAAKVRGGGWGTALVQHLLCAGA